MDSLITSYLVDEATVVQIEADPPEGFAPASDGLAGRVRDAVAPAVAAARVVLEKVKEARPDEVELKFGIKVTGGTHWLVGKAVAESTFEVTLTWHADAAAGRPDRAARLAPEQGTTAEDDPPAVPPP